MTTDIQRGIGRFAALLAAAVLAMVPTGSHADTPEDGSADTPAEGVVGSAVRSTFPGLYVPDTIAVQGDADHGFVIRAPLSCAALESVFAAGDWRIDQQLAVPPEAAAFLAIGGLTPMTVLADGPAVAGLITNPRPEGCRARLIEAASGPVIVGRDAAPTVTEGWSLATRCLRADDDLLVTVLVGTQAASGQFHVAIGPDGAATLDESTDSIVVTGPVGLLSLMSTLLTDEVAGRAPVVPEGSTFATAQVGTGTATLEQDGTRGTIHLTGVEWYDDRTGASGTVAAEFPFQCAGVGSIGA